MQVAQMLQHDWQPGKPGERVPEAGPRHLDATLEKRAMKTQGLPKRVPRTRSPPAAGHMLPRRAAIGTRKDMRRVGEGVRGPGSPSQPETSPPAPCDRCPAFQVERVRHDRWRTSPPQGDQQTRPAFRLRGMPDSSRRRLCLLCSGWGDSPASHRRRRRCSPSE